MTLFGRATINDRFQSKTDKIVKKKKKKNIFYYRVKNMLFLVGLKLHFSIFFLAKVQFLTLRRLPTEKRIMSALTKQRRAASCLDRTTESPAIRVAR
jgi:hypothetical protein